MLAVSLADKMYPKMADIVEYMAFRGKEPGKTKRKGEKETIEFSLNEF